MSVSDADRNAEVEADARHFGAVIADYERITGTTNIASAPAALAKQYVATLAAELAGSRERETRLTDALADAEIAIANAHRIVCDAGALVSEEPTA